MRNAGLCLLIVATVLVAGNAAWAQADNAAVAMAAGPMSVPDNQWVKLGDCPPDPLGRELQPGRGAYWAFDPGTGKFFRYGGYTPTDDNSLWTYDLASRTWENPLKVDYAWPPPADRPGAGAWWRPVYDSKRKVFWLHGGAGLAARHDKALFDDLWQFDPASGKFTAAKSKDFPRFGAPVVYDAKNDLIVRGPAHNGEWAAMHNRERTWVYDPNTNKWEGRQTKQMPGYYGMAALVYDANAGLTVCIGKSKDNKAEVWTYDAAANLWQQLEIAGETPDARVYPAACYDPANKVVLLYGGVGQPDKGYGYMHRGGGKILDDTWALDVAKKSWTRLNVAAPVRPKLPGEGGLRFTLAIAMDYDTRNNAVVLSAPAFGVWALRYRGPQAEKLPELKLAGLAPFAKPTEPKEPVFPQATPNKKLLDLPAGRWVNLGGGGAIGGGEVPMTYDEATGFCLKFGGCNNGGTTFASGYGNDLCAYDPATERWIALRWVDPCGPPRPANGCTRYYAYDPDSKVTWFAKGTAGNGLARSDLNPGGPNMWCYDGLKDRYMQVPTKAAPKFGTGVAGVFDRVNKQLIFDPKEQWAGANVVIFKPGQKSWTDTGVKAEASIYTFPCFVDSLKGMMIIDLPGGKKGEAAAPTRTMLFDTVSNQWKDLAPKGDTLPSKGRPTLAYDPANDVVINCQNDQTFVYSVKDNTWTALDVGGKTPVAELLVYDTRHKVFLGCTRGGEMHAFRVK